MEFKPMEPLASTSFELVPTDPKIQFFHQTPWLLLSFIDAGTIIALSILSGIVYHSMFYTSSGDIATYAGMGLLTAIVFLAVQRIKGAPAVLKSGNLQDVAEGLVGQWALTVLFSLAIVFTVKMGDELSRGAIFLMFLMGFPALVMSRAAGSALLEFMVGKLNVQPRRTIYIGNGEDATLSFKEAARLGYDVQSRLTQENLEDAALLAMEVISEIQRLSAAAIVIDLPLSREREVARLLKELADVPVQIVWLVERTSLQLLERHLGLSADKAAIELRRPPMTRFERSLKRTVDIVFASSCIVLLLPLLVITAAIIKMESPGPVIFRQRRRGRDGRTFTIYKFRSMKVMENGPVIQQARRDDPRFTRISQIIRRLSIDELPQLFNVLNGDMSLIGPRPHAVAHDEEYTQQIPNYDFRYFMKPGLTGWAQVNGYRGETRTLDAMEKRIECDLWYANHWSFWLDIKILFRTALIVATQKNAH